MDAYQEGLVTVAIYLFFLSAVCLPVVIGWFTHQFNKRLKRLDNVISIIEETEKYYDKEAPNQSSGGGS